MSRRITERFLDYIAQGFSAILENDEREWIIRSVPSVLGERMRQISSRSQSGDEKSICKHQQSCADNVMIGFVRSFLATYSLKYGINMIPVLLLGKLFKKPSLIYKLGGKDTISFAMFMSTFVSLYKGVLCTLRRFRNSCDSLNSLVAGAVAGLSLMLDSNRNRRRTIALYFSTRTCHFLVRGLWKYFMGNLLFFQTLEIPRQDQERAAIDHNQPIRENDDQEILIQEEKRNWNLKLREILKQCTAGILTMLSSGQIIYSFCCEQDTVPRQYFSLLLSHSGLKKEYGKSRATAAVQVFNECVNARASSTRYLSDSDDLTCALDPALPLKSLSEFHLQRSPTHEFVMCSLQHPGRGYCLQEFGHCIVAEFQRGVLFYGPLYILASIIFKGGKLLRDPLGSSRRIVLSTIRSAVFITAWVSCAWSSSCAFRKVIGTDRPAQYFLSGFLAGSSVFIEGPGRRLELALYFVPRAIETAWNCAVKWGYWNSISCGEIIYFSIASSVLMTIYQHDPESIHDGYRKAMKRLIGVN
jgi:hypothetical protein